MLDAIGDVISSLIQSYGITGLAFGALLFLLYKNKQSADARISELEKQADEHQQQQITNYKEMIGEYVELVKSKTEVLSKLTSVLESMNSTLLRLENRSKD